MTPLPRILVIGGTGFIGGRLTKEALQRGHLTMWTYAHQPSPFLDEFYLQNTPDNYPFREMPCVQVNFTDSFPELEQAIGAFKPQVVMYSAVAPIKSNTLTYCKVNVDGVEQTLNLLRQHAPDCLFIYLSTNAVFDGIDGDYLETDRPTPENRQDAYRDYAITKYEGEQTTLHQWENSLVVRVSMVDGYMADGQLSPRLANVLKELQAGKSIPRYIDRLISPTVVDTIVGAIFEMTEQTFGYRGVLHVAGDAQLSDFDYTQYLCRYLGIDETLVEMQTLESSESYEPPSDTTLDITFSRQLFNTPFLDVEAQFRLLFPNRQFRLD